MKKSFKAGALPLLAIILTALNLRTAVTGFTPLFEIIGADLDFGPSLYGVLGTIVTASFAVFGLLSAMIARRVGLERAMTIAVALTTAGIVLRALAPTTAVLVAATVVAASGIGASNVLVIPLVKKYFSDSLKTVSAMYIALLQVGQFVAPLIAIPVALTWGWQVAIGMWAVMTAGAVVMWVVLGLREQPAKPDTPAEPAPALTDQVRLTGAWRTPLLWSLVLMMGITSLNVHAIFTWLPIILADAGADPAAGGRLVALFSVLGLPAAFVVPPLAIKMRNPFIIVAVCTACMVLGYLGLLFSPGTGAVVWVMLLGIGVSTFPLCLTLVNVRTRTTAGATQLSGAMQGIGYAIACLGPIGMGALYASSGTWTGAFGVLFGSLVLLLVSGFIACRPAMLEDQLQGHTRVVQPRVGAR